MDWNTLLDLSSSFDYFIYIKLALGANLLYRFIHTCRFTSFRNDRQFALGIDSPEKIDNRGFCPV